MYWSVGDRDDRGRTLVHIGARKACVEYMVGFGGLQLACKGCFMLVFHWVHWLSRNEVHFDPGCSSCRASSLYSRLYDVIKSSSRQRVG